MRRASLVRDSEIAGQVIHAIARDARVGIAGRVRVTTKNGTVRLSGDVDTAKGRVAAEELARRVDGVVGVENRLTVVIPGQTDDEELQERVVQAICRDSKLSGRDIGTTVDDGIVHVLGRVDTADQEQLAERVVSSVTGVQAVVSDLQVGDVDP